MVDHAVPRCESRELFKGVLADRARGVFQGKVIVRPDAQKTDGKQMAQVLMLSEDAEFDSKPELEIHADDVVCGHGSTAAEIDADLLFYLRARGIPLGRRPRHADRELRRRGARQGRGRGRARGADAYCAQPAGGAVGLSSRAAAKDRYERDAKEDGPRSAARLRRRGRSAPISRSWPREVYGKPLVYLDNGASAQKPRVVLDTIQRAYSSEYANVHRGLHYLSNTATAEFEEARETVRRFLNAPSTDEIIFTRNATEAINLVASSYGGMAIGEGDEIVLSIMEHHSNIVPWHFHRERKGAVLKWAPIADDGTFLLDEFEKLLTAAHQDRRASRTCRTCSAPSCRSRR